MLQSKISLYCIIYCNIIAEPQRNYIHNSATRVAACELRRLTLWIYPRWSMNFYHYIQSGTLVPCGVTLTLWCGAHFISGTSSWLVTGLTAHSLYFTFPPYTPKCWRPTATYTNSTMEVVEEVRLDTDCHDRGSRRVYVPSPDTVRPPPPFYLILFNFTSLSFEKHSLSSKSQSMSCTGETSTRVCPSSVTLSFCPPLGHSCIVRGPWEQSRATTAYRRPMHSLLAALSCPPDCMLHVCSTEIKCTCACVWYLSWWLFMTTPRRGERPICPTVFVHFLSVLTNK